MRSTWWIVASVGLAACSPWQKPDLGGDTCGLSWFRDADGDGWGDPGDAVTACEAPSGRVANADDCDDASVTAAPDAAEVSNDGVDQDCNGADTITCHVDADHDGAGDAGTLLADDGQCDTIAGEAPLPNDCNDQDPAFSPDAFDVPEDGIDQDCNQVDAIWCLFDGDLDGFGADSVAAADASCDAAQQETLVGGDCDDLHSDAFPGGVEVSDDGIDQDCSGTDQISCFTDDDGDGVGVAFAATAPDALCAPGTAPRAGDCDDAVATTRPGAPEVYDDGVDQDCNGADTVTCWRDADGDGHGGTVRLRADGACLADESSTGDDCDDVHASVHPGATEICNGLDDDCDEATSEDGTASNDAGLTGLDLQALIDATAPGGEIYVCKGTWAGPLVLDGGHELHGMGGTANVVIDGGGADSALWIRPGAGGPVHVSGLTLTNGAAAAGGALRVTATDPVTLDDLALTDSLGTDGGGLFAAIGSDLTLRSVTLSGNTGTRGGGAWIGGSATWSGGEVADNAADEGAGLWLGPVASLDGVGLTVRDNRGKVGAGVRALGALTLDASGLFGNTAAADGGGLWVGDGALVDVSATTIDGNVAASGGGAYVASGGALTLASVSLDDNAADDGAGLFLAAGGALDLSDSTLRRNLALLRGGGVHCLGDLTAARSAVVDGGATEGGGVWFGDGTLSLTDIAFSGNYADLGGALVVGARATLTRVSVESNTGEDGAGVLVEEVGGPIPSLVWTGGTLRDNTASLRGGGLRVASGVQAVTLTEVEIARNHAPTGGGVWLGTSARLQLDALALDGNTATDGGGVYSLGTLTFDTCAVRNNEATRGGGVFLQGGTLSAAMTEWTPTQYDNGPNDVETATGATWSGSLVTLLTCDTTGCR
jgi:hypothetical protein